jgi:hypothetical protein
VVGNRAFSIDRRAGDINYPSERGGMVSGHSPVSDPRCGASTSTDGKIEPCRARARALMIFNSLFTTELVPNFPEQAKVDNFVDRNIADIFFGLSDNIEMYF